MVWGKAGSTTLGSAGDALTTPTLSSNGNLHYLYHGLPTGGELTEYMTMGSGGTKDTGSNYANRVSSNGGSDSTFTSRANIVNAAKSGATTPEFGIGYILNIAGEEKLLISHHVNASGNGAGTAPERSEAVGKHVQTSVVDDIVSFDNTGSGDFASDSNLSVLGSEITPASAVPAIENIQDNSLFVEKDTAKRYWFTPQTVDTEEAFSFTTTDTVNALWGNRIYGMKLLSGHSGLNKYIKKIKTYHPTNPTGSRLTTGTLYHVILDSSGTEIARSAGVSASSVSNNTWAETTLSTPVKLLENYTVGVTISTGSGSSYLGTAVNNNSSSPTNTTRYYKDESGTVGLSTSETMLMVFDSDPATGISIPSIWQVPSALSYTGSNVVDSTSGGYRYLEFLSSGTVTIEGYEPDILIVNGGNSASSQVGGSGGQIRQITGQTGLSGTYTVTIGGANTASVFTGESGYTATSGASGGAGSWSYSGVAGGAGTSIASFPATYSYSGGGGGGAGQQNSNYRGGAGGTGGGGGGGRGKNGWGGYAGTGGRNNGGAGSSSQRGAGGAGGANTGSGGGGGGRYNGVGAAGAGGTGVFVLRVPE